MILAAFIAPAGVSAVGPDLGEALTAVADLTVMPDGTGLPPGRGDVATGARLYAEHCQACHGAGGQGGSNDVLVGGRGSLTGDTPVRTIGSYWPYATTVFDYIRRAMPYQQPGSLDADQVYAVTAYLLHRNGIVGADAVMSAATLPLVVMPNRDGFQPAPGHSAMGSPR